MSRPILLAFIAALAALVLPASALAQDTNAPPGVSAADQYLETIPRASGNATVGNGQRPDPANPEVAARTRNVLPAAAAKRLKRSGDTGEDAAALAASTAPAAPKPGAARPTIVKGSSGSPLATIGRVATGTGDDGLGVLFPVLFALGAVAVGGAAFWRRRPSAT
ncbi:MAG: hypothetical protein JWO90_2888 [Solirubrobacterales bacterium]|nr:hypothetical protein [Solirubrobacterales bacterium]